MLLFLFGGLRVLPSYPNSESSSSRFQEIGIERSFLNRSPCSITSWRSAII